MTKQPGNYYGTYVFWNVGSFIGHLNDMKKFLPQLPVGQVMAAARFKREIYLKIKSSDKILKVSNTSFINDFYSFQSSIAAMAI